MIQTEAWALDYFKTDEVALFVIVPPSSFIFSVALFYFMGFIQKDSAS